MRGPAEACWSPNRSPMARPGFISAPSDEAGVVDLSINRPATDAYLDAFTALLPRLAKNRHYAAIQDYHPAEGPLWARSAVAEWLKPVAGDGDPGRVVLTIGAQHALDCVLSAVAQKGDVILADEVTYQGINALCRSHGLDLRGLADGQRRTSARRIRSCLRAMATASGFPRAQPA